MTRYSAIYLALAGLWGGASLVSLYLLVTYSAGIPVETIALYFMAVPFSLATAFYFLGKGIASLLPRTQEKTINELLRMRLAEDLE